MNEQELQLAFIQFLAQKTGAKSLQELEAVIQQLGEEGLKQAYAEFIQTMQQQQVRAAKFGAKLNYIKQLRGQCPDGYEVKYFKNGGGITEKKCVACQKGQEISEPTNAVEAFKCGRKAKKRENGGSVEMDKCGSKMKKKACGGTVKKDLKGNKMFGPASIPDNEFKYKEFAADLYGPRMRVGIIGGSVGKPGYEIQAEDLETRNRFTGQNDWDYVETGSGRTPNGGWSNNLYNRFSDSDENSNAGAALNYIQRRAALNRAKQSFFAR